MTTSQSQKNFCSDSERYAALMNLISQWPEWKIQALCLDKSDLTIKAAVEQEKRNRYVSGT